MQHSFICPECRNEHTDPAEGHFSLAALCFDCAFEIDDRVARSVNLRIPIAA